MTFCFILPQKYKEEREREKRIELHREHEHLKGQIKMINFISSSEDKMTKKKKQREIND